jgi:hypothetical protein
MQIILDIVFAHNHDALSGDNRQEQIVQQNTDQQQSAANLQPINSQSTTIIGTVLIHRVRVLVLMAGRASCS